MKFSTPKGIIAGMDEAGRGSWAGPVVAAAVILKKGLRLKGLKDSKLLTSNQREQLYQKITKSCSWGVGMATHQEIDEFRLLHATYRAFRRALEALPIKPDHILIDGRDRFSFVFPHTSVIRGDRKFRCIAAASILAKVTRDRLMQECASKYPQYGFEIHKGYGTRAHQEALSEYGPSEVHRKSFAPLKNLKWVQEAFL